MKARGRRGVEEGIMVFFFFFGDLMQFMSLNTIFCQNERDTQGIPHQGAFLASSGIVHDEFVDKPSILEAQYWKAFGRYIKILILS